MKRSLLSIMEVFLIAALLCSCNKKADDVSEEHTSDQSGEQQQTAVDHSENYNTDDEFANMLLNSIVITVTDVRDGEGEAKVGNVSVSVPNLSKIYETHKSEFKDDMTGEKLKSVIRENEVDSYQRIEL